MTAFNDQLKTDLRETFFNPEEFAEPVTFSPAAGLPRIINGIFDNEYRSIDPATEQPIVSTQPNLLINENDLTAPLTQGDKFTIRGKVYKLIEPQTDGVGTIRILLHEEV